MIPRRASGPIALARRLWAARRGDVRAKEDLYHLRGVITFIGVFAATIVVPAMLLAYYGLAGVRARQASAAADVARQASSASVAFAAEAQRGFTRFEDAALNRLKSGQSVTTALREMSPALRIALRFDDEGELVAPFDRPRTQPSPTPDVSFFAPLAAALRAPPSRAPALFGQAAREARDPATRAWMLQQQAARLADLGDVASAEDVLARLGAEYPGVRDPLGFRVGDLARLRSGTLLLTRDPPAGIDALKRLVEDLALDRWSVGYGGEPAVARRALDLLAGKADAEWASQWRSRLDERSEQLFDTERLLPELETLGARGAGLRGEDEEFAWRATASAFWASTWTDDGEYVFALDAERQLQDLATMAQRMPGSPDVRVVIVRPGDATPEGALARDTLAAWMPGTSFAVVARDPEALAARQSEESLRATGVVLLSVVMIGVGALATARLVQRELDLARDKADFAAHVSHELRSPITQIRLKAEALQLGLATNPDAVARHHDAIVRESERLSRLVDNMLDFSAIERGNKRYSLRPGDLGATVLRAVEAARVAMETRGMEIDVALPEDLPAVWHDVDAVGQCMTNLLSNAAKYGAEAAWIGVRVESDDDEVRVAVSDRGIGLATEDHLHVFDQFWRSPDPQARRRKGTGIGLTIVKYVMDAHGGRVAIRSAPGQGATFTLYFPTRAPGGERHGA